MAITLNIGSRLPAYPTSLGRVLLAGLPDDELDDYLAKAELRPLTSYTVTEPARLREILHEVRRDGFALIDGEREVGVRSVAAGIRYRDRVIAALNVSANAARLSVEELRERCAPMVIEHAEAISAEIATR